MTVSRRDFLRATGFTLTAAATGCSRPSPNTRSVHPDQLEVRPGVREYFATTCAACSAGCGILATVHDHRPVKLEGLPDHPVSRGGLCAGGQASVLGVYDELRLRHPLIDGRRTTWDKLDTELRARLAGAEGGIRVLTSTDAAASPTTIRQIERFLQPFVDARHDVYDVLSATAVSEAHLLTHGVRVVPRFRFDRAAVVVGFDADFLGTWISPVEFSSQYAGTRPEWHTHFEVVMTVTGAKADQRIALSPSDVGRTVAALLRSLQEQRASVVRPGANHAASGTASGVIEELAERLWRARGRALVVCGSGDRSVQACVNGMNDLLDAYGSTVDLDWPSRQRLGNDRAAAALLDELRRGSVAALILAGVNPVHDLPDGAIWREVLSRVPILISVSERLDETSALANYTCPPPHFLESWGDVEPVSGILCLRQPLALASGMPRSLDASLAAWSGETQNAREILRERWRRDIYDSALDGDSFDAFWDAALQRGWLDRRASGIGAAGDQRTVTIPSCASEGNANDAAKGEFLLVAYPAAGILDGRQSFNPWLLELPDPITKASWQNCASLSPVTAAALSVDRGDLVRIRRPDPATDDGTPTVETSTIELPVIVQPGQHDDVVAVPLGYGQQISARFADFGPRWPGAAKTGSHGTFVGVNVAPLLGRYNDAGGLASVRVEVIPTGRKMAIAHAHGETYLRPMGRGRWGRGGVQTVIRTYSETREPPGESEATAAATLWSENHRCPAQRWGMVIDLDACTGCSACVVACQVENNIPVVGRDEMARNRAMHWLRIDSYFLGESSHPAVVHQPITCHHCGNAPCETVCPVFATTHSSDGLNQQVYSRCIGTRYCMNNCPLRVRRFNWFDHDATAAVPNPALNPAVTVRSRGVAEKCTFCVQRIQEARLAARQQGRTIADGDVTPACAQSCPARAISFGDLNDPDSHVTEFARSERAYQLFEELNLDSAVHYLAVRHRGNTDASDDVTGET